MINFQKKRGWRNIAQSRPVLVLLSILILFFAYAVVGFMGKMQATAEKREIAENKLAQLEKQKKELSSNIAKLKSNSGIEESIREKFGLVKEGEGVIIVVEDKNKPEAPKKDPGGFFYFFMNWFK